MAHIWHGTALQLASGLLGMIAGRAGTGPFQRRLSAWAPASALHARVQLEASSSVARICSCGKAVHRQGGGSAQALARQAEAEAEADQARKRFGNAKSISSAQFNADEESKTMDYEKQVGTLGLESGPAKSWLHRAF